MKSSLFTILLLLGSSSLSAKENNPDYLPPPVLEAEPSMEPELVPVKKKDGRGLASVGKPTKRVRVNGDVRRAENQGECPKGFHIADFHGWLCRREN